MTAKSSDIANRVNFLQTSRFFPEESQPLSIELTKSYIDIANNVNVRTIGTFATVPTVTGNAYYFDGERSKHQTVRKIFRFNSTSPLNHNIKDVIAGNFVNCFGSYTDGTNTFGLIFGTSVAVAGVIQFHLTPTQIVFTLGAGAPALTSGIIALEWLANT
jgi:hypothetical protein